MSDAIAPAVPAAAPPATEAPAATDTPAASPPPKPGITRKRLGEAGRSYTAKTVHVGPPMGATKAAAPAATPSPTTADKPADTPPAAVAPNAAPSLDKPSPEKPPEPEPPKLDAAEESRRLARIQRAESKLEQDRRAFAQERAQHTEDLRKVQLINNAKQALEKDPFGFLEQGLGLTRQRLLDLLLADGAKPEAEKAGERVAREQQATQARLAQFEKELQASKQAQREQAHAASVADYKRSAVAPIFADKAGYEVTLRALGDKAVDEVFALQQAHYRVTAKRGTPEMLTPAQAADRIEKHLRSQRDLLSGASVAPAQGAEKTTRTEPPAAAASGSQTQKPAPTKAGAFRAPRPSYVAKASARYTR